MADAVTKTENGVDGFTKSEFAYTPSNLPSEWKLRLVATPGGPVDAGIVGAAVAALGAGFRGNTVDLPSAARAGVIARVRAAWLKANTGKSAADMPDVLKAMSELLDTSNGLAGWQPFMELEKFADPPEWIPLLPKPGSYQHPQYGPIEITSDRNAHFMSQFKNGVYQPQLPIDAEHRPTDEGAHGWITDMRQNTDGSIDGRSDWSDLGEAAIKGNRFRYISPALKDTWVDNYGTSHSDIVVGAALTTRPWFKHGALRPMVASERGMFVSDIRGEPDDATVIVLMELVATPKPPERSAHVPEKIDPIAVAKTLTEDEAKQFAEMQASLKTLTEERDAIKAERDTFKGQVDTQATQFSELNATVKNLTEDARKTRLSAIADKLHGGAAQHLSLMTTLATTFGEDSAELKQYTDAWVATTEQIKASNLFKEIGSGHPGNNATSAEGKLEGLTQQYREKHPDVTYEQAYSAVLTANPELYAEYQA